MNKKEQIKLAESILKKHGYSKAEIKRILKYAFDDNKKKNGT